MSGLLIRSARKSKMIKVRGTPVTDVALRLIDDSDLDALFEQMRDPEAVRMAAFTAKDPHDRDAFDRHMATLRTSPNITARAVTHRERLVGSIGCFVIEGDTEITFWIDRSVWGQGIASEALALFLDTVAVRPLYARAASDNVGSLKVLQKAGFTIIGTEVSYANARNAEIEETVLRLD
ncbi:GNAT family N-acetyltransferase [Actinosynnema sp. CA-248983]